MQPGSGAARAAVRITPVQEQRVIRVVAPREPPSITAAVVPPRTPERPRRSTRQHLQITMAPGRVLPVLARPGAHNTQERVGTALATPAPYVVRIATEAPLEARSGRA